MSWRSASVTMTSRLSGCFTGPPRRLATSGASKGLRLMTNSVRHDWCFCQVDPWWSTPLNPNADRPREARAAQSKRQSSWGHATMVRHSGFRSLIDRHILDSTEEATGCCVPLQATPLLDRGFALGARFRSPSTMGRPRRLARDAAYRRQFRAHLWRNVRRKWGCSAAVSDVELFDVAGALHDEAEARRDVFAHQIVDRPIGLELVVDRHLQRDPLLRIERRVLQVVCGHLSQTFEAHHVRLRVAFHVLSQDLLFVRVIERPVRLFADVDSVQRRLRQKDVPRLNQWPQVPVEERQQQRRDVVAV